MMRLLTPSKQLAATEKAKVAFDSPIKMGMLSNLKDDRWVRVYCVLQQSTLYLLPSMPVPSIELTIPLRRQPVEFQFHGNRPFGHETLDYQFTITSLGQYQWVLQLRVQTKAEFDGWKTALEKLAKIDTNFDADADSPGDERRFNFTAASGGQYCHQKYSEEGEVGSLEYRGGFLALTGGGEFLILKNEPSFSPHSIVKLKSCSVVKVKKENVGRDFAFRILPGNAAPPIVMSAGDKVGEEEWIDALLSAAAPHSLSKLSLTHQHRAFRVLETSSVRRGSVGEFKENFERENFAREKIDGDSVAVRSLSQEFTDENSDEIFRLISDGARKPCRTVSVNSLCVSLVPKQNWKEVGAGGLAKCAGSDEDWTSLVCLSSSGSVSQSKIFLVPDNHSEIKEWARFLSVITEAASAQKSESTLSSLIRKSKISAAAQTPSKFQIQNSNFSISKEEFKSAKTGWVSVGDVGIISSKWKKYFAIISSDFVFLFRQRDLVANETPADDRSVAHVIENIFLATATLVDPRRVLSEFENLNNFLKNANWMERYIEGGGVECLIHCVSHFNQKLHTHAAPSLLPSSSLPAEFALAQSINLIFKIMTLDQKGLHQVLSMMGSLNQIICGLAIDSPTTHFQILDIISGVCLKIPDGHRLVINALQYFQQFSNSSNKFDIFAEKIRRNEYGTEMKCRYLLALNAIIESAPDSPFPSLPSLPPAHWNQNQNPSWSNGAGARLALRWNLDEIFISDIIITTKRECKNNLTQTSAASPGEIKNNQTLRNLCKQYLTMKFYDDQLAAQANLTTSTQLLLDRLFYFQNFEFSSHGVDLCRTFVNSLIQLPGPALLSQLQSSSQTVLSVLDTHRLLAAERLKLQAPIISEPKKSAAPPPSLPPPPPPPPMRKGKPVTKRRPSAKLRILNWKKLNGKELTGSVWAKLNPDGNFNDEELDEIEKYFSISTQSQLSQKTATPALKIKQTIELLDHKRAHALAISLSRFKFPLDEIISEICQLKIENLNLDDLCALQSIIPTADEIQIVKSFSGDVGVLGAAEKFFLRLSDVQDWKNKLETAQILKTLEIDARRNIAQLTSLTKTCREIITSVPLREVLQEILKLGNQLNSGTYNGECAGFQIEILRDLAKPPPPSKKSQMGILKYAVVLHQKKNSNGLSWTFDAAEISLAANVNFEEIETSVSTIQKNFEFLKSQLTTAVPDDSSAENNYAKTIENFLGRAEYLGPNMCHDLAKAKEIFDETLTYFGEKDPARSTPHELFSTLSIFLAAVERAKLEITIEKLAPSSSHPPASRARPIQNVTTTSIAEKEKHDKNEMQASSAREQMAEIPGQLPLPKEYWPLMSLSVSCKSCASPFNLLVPSHRCRCCGGAFCESCSCGRHSVPGHGNYQRVCLDCKAFLKTVGIASPPPPTHVIPPTPFTPAESYPEAKISQLQKAPERIEEEEIIFCPPDDAEMF